MLDLYIDFHCAECGREIRVAPEKAGLRGRCPQCQAAIEVPSTSEPRPLFAERDASCLNPKLQQLYDQIIGLVSAKIKTHTVIDGEVLAFELRTHQGRTQVVYVLHTPNSSEDLVDFCSRVGKLAEWEAAVVALKSAQTDPFVNVYLDKDDILWVRTVQKLKSISDGEAIDHLLRVARHSDALEEVIFGWDRE